MGFGPAQGASGGSITTDTVSLDDGSATAPSVTFTSDTGTNTGIYLIGQNRLGVTTDGTLRLEIDATGDLVPNGTIDLGTSSARFRTLYLNTALDLTLDDSTTSATAVVQTLRHTSTGTAANGLGVSQLFQLEDAAGNTDDAAQFDVVWNDATSTSEDSSINFKTRIAGAALATQFSISNGVSCPGAGTNSERFGVSSTAGGLETAAFGRSSTAASDFSTVVGFGATANSNARQVCIGWSANASGLASILLGQGVGDGGFKAIVLGDNQVATADNQFIVGGINCPITTGYLGKGVTHATPAAFTVTPTGGSGAAVAGVDLILSGSLSGDAATAGGGVLFQVAKASSGTTRTTVGRFLNTGAFGLVEQAAPAASASGNAIIYADSTAHTSKVSTNAGNYCDLHPKTGRATAQTAANASVLTYANGAADGSFEVSANVLVTTSSGESFTVTCSYTDEGNTARTLTMPFVLLAGTVTGTIAFANGAVPYEGVLTRLRVKASTTITIATTGTFTGCTYNVEAGIRQVS